MIKHKVSKNQSAADCLLQDFKKYSICQKLTGLKRSVFFLNLYNINYFNIIPVYNRGQSLFVVINQTLDVDFGLEFNMQTSSHRIASIHFDYFPREYHYTFT